MVISASPIAFLSHSRPALPAPFLLPPGATMMSAFGAFSNVKSGVTVIPPIVFNGLVDSATVTTRNDRPLSATMNTSAGPAKSISSTPSNNSTATVFTGCFSFFCASGSAFARAGSDKRRAANAIGKETMLRTIKYRKMVRIEYSFQRRLLASVALTCLCIIHQ